MNIFSLIVRAFGGLRTARIRTFLTAIAIAVGGFVLTLTLAASNGARLYVDNMIGDAIADNALVISKMNLSGADEYTKPQKYNSKDSIDEHGVRYITDDDLNKIRNYDFIESSVESYQVTVQYIQFSQGDSVERYRGTVYSDTPSQRRVDDLAAGKVESLKRGEIIISDAYREDLKYKESSDLLGKKVRISVQSPLDIANADNEAMTKDFVVVGVSKSTGLSGYPLGIYVNKEDAKALSEYSTEGTELYKKYFSIDAVIKDGNNIEVMQKAQKQLEQDGFATQSAKDAQDMVGEVIDVLQGIVLGFGAITLIASVFGVINTMYISVLERTREIGLMKALGMSGRGLKWLFRIEAAWIGLLGGVIGSGLGWVTGALLNPWITNKLGIKDSLLVFPTLDILIMIALLVIVAMGAGMLPARKAAKLNPVEALKTE